MKRKKEQLEKELATIQKSMSLSEGKMESYFDRLEKEFGVKDVSEAEEFIENCNKEIEKLEEEKKEVEKSMTTLIEGNICTG